MFNLKQKNIHPNESVQESETLKLCKLDEQQSNTGNLEWTSGNQEVRVKDEKRKRKVFKQWNKMILFGSSIKCIDTEKFLLLSLKIWTFYG